MIITVQGLQMQNDKTSFKEKLILKTKILIKIIFTLFLIIFGIIAYNAANNINHNPKSEFSPVWLLFGKSDWSVFITFYYISYLYLIFNAISYCGKMLEGRLRSLTSQIIVMRFFSVFKAISTLVLLGFGFMAFLAMTDIWHGYEPNVSTEWTVVYVYFYLYLFYLSINVVDICLKLFVQSADTLTQKSRIKGNSFEVKKF